MKANKKFLKESNLQQHDFESVLVRRDSDEVTELDEAKKDYFQKIDELRKRALRQFKIRDYAPCIESVEEALSVAAHAYDLETTRNLYKLKSLVAIFFDDHSTAL